MKRYFIIALSAVTLCFSCKVVDPEVNQPSEPTESKLTVMLPSVTRVSMGGMYGDRYPITWTGNDRISANGMISEAIEIDSYSAQKATFSFGENKLEYPCNVVYPHHFKVEGENATIEFKAEQHYGEEPFTAGIVPMCGYAKDDKSNVTLSSLVGLLRLKMNARAEGIRLASITVTSESGKRLSGEFSLYVPTSTITPTSNTSTSISRYALCSSLVKGAGCSVKYFCQLPSAHTSSSF